VDTSELQIRFGEAVRRRRLEARIGQEALAAQAGIHRTHVGLIERGGRQPTLGVIFKVATALGITMAELLTDVERPDQPTDEPPAIPRGRPTKASQKTRGKASRKAK
jgi:transcriptional regulator with XRE-family HTH domain